LETPFAIAAATLEKQQMIGDGAPSPLGGFNNDPSNRAC